MAYARQRKASVAMHDPDAPPSGDATARKDSLAVIRDAIHRKAARKRENSDVNSLVSDFGYLHVPQLRLIDDFILTISQICQCHNTRL